MAERRMFSKRIVSSARFLKMPVSTQCLYFHLGLHADDDGIVEAYTIMNLVGATEDDLKILVAKEFVTVLNEDLVTYITDWKENNKIRADRKVDSLYKDLLLQILPDVELLGKKPRADRQPKDNHGTSQGQPKDNHGTSQGQPKDNHGTDNGQHRLGKDRLGKDRLDKVSMLTDEQANKLSQFAILYENNIGLINQIVKDWLEDMTDVLDLQLFKRGIEICAERGNNNLGYLKGIIKKWTDNNITTMDQLKAYELQTKSNKNSNYDTDKEKVQESTRVVLEPFDFSEIRKELGYE